MKWNLCSVVVLVFCMLTSSLHAEQSPKEKEEESKDPSVWMRMKLEYSKRILEGVTKADFAMIEDNAAKMRGLNRFERFVRGRWEGYTGQLQAFQDANEEMIKQARKNNVEGATLAFTQMTISCVACHKRLREEAK